MRREFHVRFCEGLGVRFPRATRLVILCRSRRNRDEAERVVRRVLAYLKLSLHPEKTRRLDLGWGKDGFDFLGCHLRKRMSGKLWEKKGRRLYFLHRWPSQRAMRSVRQKIRELTDRKWCWVKDVRVLIEKLNPILRGWGAYFRTGNASTKFIEIDGYVWWRLKRFLKKRKGRHLRAGEANAWTRAFFVEHHGLHRLQGTTRYPEAA